MSSLPLDLVDDMFDLGVEMRRERARREAPDLGDSAIEVIVDAWLCSRPSAPIGDSAGTPGTARKPAGVAHPRAASPM